jgi:Ser/Thr protein kinase RdoA (MazF antagonist)
LERYPIRPALCTLINHWENTTFRITTTTGKQFLLRVHRPGYHTEAGILEELTWLERLSPAATFRVPAPFRSRNDRLVEPVASPLLSEPRHCCLFEWIDGRFVQKSLRPSLMSHLGTVIAEMQRLGEGLPVVHRRYWDAEGLVGKHPKFGTIDELRGISVKTQDVVSQGRELVLRHLKRFERDHPHKQGLIHADLHFGNVLVTPGGFAVIDFDDCGWGFHAYDLAVSLLSTGQLLGEDRQKEMPRLKDALIEAYAARKNWEASDEAILPYLTTARKLAMLGWLNSRSDNPRLRQRLKSATARTAAYLKKTYDL